MIELAKEGNTEISTDTALIIGNLYKELLRSCCRSARRKYISRPLPPEMLLPVTDFLAGNTGIFPLSGRVLAPPLISRHDDGGLALIYRLQPAGVPNLFYSRSVKIDGFAKSHFASLSKLELDGNKENYGSPISYEAPIK